MTKDIHEVWLGKSIAIMCESLYSVVSKKIQYCACVYRCIYYVYTQLTRVEGNEDGREEEE